QSVPWQSGPGFPDPLSADQRSTALPGSGTHGVAGSGVDRHLRGVLNARGDPSRGGEHAVGNPHSPMRREPRRVHRRCHCRALPHPARPRPPPVPLPTRIRRPRPTPKSQAHPDCRLLHRPTTPLPQFRRKLPAYALALAQPRPQLGFLPQALRSGHPARFPRHRRPGPPPLPQFLLLPSFPGRQRWNSVSHPPTGRVDLLRLPTAQNLFRPPPRQSWRLHSSPRSDSASARVAARRVRLELQPGLLPGLQPPDPTCHAVVPPTLRGIPQREGRTAVPPDVRPWRTWVHRQKTLQPTAGFAGQQLLPPTHLVTWFVVAGIADT